MIKHSFETGRIYNFPQKIFMIIELDKITFYDPSRDIAGTINLEENDIIVKAIKSFEIEACSIDLVKSLSQTRTMNHYDNGNHKWFSIFEAAKLFEKEI
tara:strand:+ start:737 stop:1033 length:297 start_codon:yes stop_codon:yes gene_type:complete